MLYVYHNRFKLWVSDFIVLSAESEVILYRIADVAQNAQHQCYNRGELYFQKIDNLLWLRKPESASVPA